MTDFVATLAMWAVAIAGGLAALWGYGRKKESDGRKKQELEQIERDYEEAAATRRKLNEIDDSGDPVERLRSQGRFRD